MKRSAIALCIALMPVCALAASTGGWKVVQRVPLGGSGFWDYLDIDQPAHHLYVSHSDRVIVLDVRDDKRVGEIDGLSGVHGAVVADDLHRGFISNGHANTVTIFDPATLKVEQTIAVGGKDPDSIVYDPYSKRVLTFNGDSNDASVIDAASGKLLGRIGLPGRPEFAVSDGHGHLFDNITDKGELAVIDPVGMKVTATWPLKDCRHPSGLAIDVAHHRLFSVCQNNIMAVTNSENGKPIASVPIGDGPDGTRYDTRRGLVFSSNGRSGTLTVVREQTPDHYQVIANVPTQKSARTMALDDATGRVYLSAAELGPRPAPTSAEPHPRPTIKPGSFGILLVARAATK